ncbi:MULTISPECIES: acylneuraminate cytidylyltransferase [Streptomyces]|uniref:N-acylneuraminate cytidylyltransferase n=3 Tax=Streptomyces TaxID=1883 RepID=A0A7Y6F0W3_9ACTN|nr:MULTISPECIES: acylneuraminate cytidylyltransferase [Streptomyces]NUV37332.1 acylneuraminate cytidylyltransferase [Streptomyces sp. KAI-27]NUV50005.1 acylneuraminate cytidylyltransferase [Streptomyces sp. CAI-78]MBL0804176.1 acylneuraminate cytidylyltransferase [Streptomyces albidoflavus]MBV1957105.1 acylneuraminate cytidylyltransferase [Streptomyces sp. BV333]MCG5121010.1 acylneuraminate cytidylyltransferase [Streptomyces sp. T7(2022)]
MRDPAPRVLAVIPARGGSKGVPGKNLAEVGGVPLVARAVHACRTARLVSEVLVSTDDPAIAEAARAAGATTVERPAPLSGDTATSEAAVLHALDTDEARHGRLADVVLLVQCTSPFLTADDVDGVTAAVLEGADTAVTAAPFHGFLWRDLATGATPSSGHGVNHDAAHRPRRQDRPEDLLETGAAYAMRGDGFRAVRHRFFGRTALVRTDPARVLEIDDPHDLARARALAPLLDRNEAPGARRPGPGDVDAVVLDFDGTQTDDTVQIDAEGRERVSVHRGDGLGIAALRDAGIPLLILSTEQNPVVTARARKLRIPVLHGVDRKDEALKQWCDEQGVDPARVLYAGNDANDLPCFALAGWPVAVASAHEPVRRAARAVTTAPGGRGAVREIASWLLGPDLKSPYPARP